MAKDAESKGRHPSVQSFTRALLEDSCALDRMIREGRIESGVRRIGAEQEVFLVDETMHPATSALEVLEECDHPQVTTELGLFNLEINLSPQRLESDCLRRMHREIDDLLERLRAAAERRDTRILLTGILPTMRLQNLTLDAMTPHARYREFNRTSVEHRGRRFRLLIKGLDELNVIHDNVMFEACNSSFQVHFQVGPEEFARLYNLAQAITGPVLAAAVNSPVLLQHRLWSETRLALFRQSVDTRSDVHQARRAPARVVFGERWVDSSVMEIFREDIARFRVFLTAEAEESPMELLDRGELPRLRALCLHNGTVCRWNRPCYGVLDGVAQLRVEHRVLPAGPTVIDEVANAAFFFGLMVALSEQHDDITRLLRFDDAKGNFQAAARYGLRARLQWIDGRAHNADDLILERLLPQARAGLSARDVDAGHVDLYLGTIEERVRSGRTGSQWILDALDALAAARGPERYRALTACMYERHLEGRPVHEWDLPRVDEGTDWHASCRIVEQLMTTDLFTVRADDLIDLAASLMDWKHIRHVPVEDERGRLTGLVSHRQLLRLVGHGLRSGAPTLTVRNIMTPDPVTVDPTTPTVEALELMRRHRISCLPVVVAGGTLVGIVTERDFIAITAKLLDDKLREI